MLNYLNKTACSAFPAVNIENKANFNLGKISVSYYLTSEYKDL
jgi:hypothetical protein